MSKASATLADGRELIYFGESADRAARYPDRRKLAQVESASQVRYDPLLGEWVILASHRQDRTYLPSAAECPLCPSDDDRLTEIPAPSYEVAVFANRFPSLSAATVAGGAVAGRAGAGGAEPAGDQEAVPGGLSDSRPGRGQCEVVCFSPDHGTSFADLTVSQAAVVLAAWTDRTEVLGAMPGVRQVFCFENRGPEIGATLTHPHGQIYAYPFVTPRTSRMLAMSRAAGLAGRNLFDDVLAAEQADGSRIVWQGEQWTAFVPFAARWPYEVHIYPHRRVPDLPALTAAEGSEFCAIYIDMLRRFGRLFDSPAPYISAWHQAPVHEGRDEFALHLELFTMRRAAGKLKYLAGSESGMGAFTTDIAPEIAAARLRQLG